MNKDNKVTRIAQIMTEMNYGGVEMVVMNYYRHIDKSKYQFDFFVLEGSEIPQKSEIESMGGRIFVVPHYKNILEYEKTLIKYFKENKYQIVHSHMNTLNVFSLFAAWVAKVPVRICHNHSTAGKGEIKKNIFKYILRPFSKIFPTHLCACSRYAGEWIYGKNADFKVFNNAIEISDFTYNPTLRKQLRKKLGLNGQFVIGHIGRFCYQKNHEFLIDIFNEICKLHSNSVLLLIGEGENEIKIKRKIRNMKLDKKVIFLGKRKDAYKYYHAMDYFVLPSRYEGFGIVAIEAQASGLQTIVSENVPDEIDITDNVRHLPLSLSPKKWAKIIVKSSVSHERKNAENKVKKAGFCIETEAEKLTNFYDYLLEELQ